MFLTVTANSALDRVIFIDRFVPGTTMRPKKVVEAVGGKGFDTSVVLRAFQLDTLAVGIVAGETGRALVRLLDRYGIRHDLEWVEGETRIAHVIVETDFNRHSHLIAHSYHVPPATEEALLEKYRQALPQAQSMIAAGSLPAGMQPSFYRTLVEMARKAGVPSLVDCPGEPMLQALPAHPDIVKMNESEFAQTFGRPAGSLTETQKNAADVCKEYDIENMVITCGEKGILAISPQDSYLAVSPRQVAVNAAGAGDAVSAVLAWRFSLNESWPEALTWAAAASAAVVLTEGTADCNPLDVDRIYPQVKVQPF